MKRKIDGNIKTFNQKELCEIYSKLNHWGWDERLGSKPCDFDILPKYNRHWYQKLFKRKTKGDYIRPVLEEIKMIVPEKELSRHHHINYLNVTNEEFEQWWSVHGEPELSIWKYW